MQSVRAASRLAILFLLPCLRAQQTHGQEGAIAATYDPLATAAGELPPSLLFDVRDAAHDRTIPIRVFLPKDPAPAPVILFSHGLGGTRDTCNYLGEHWSRRGYVVVFLQHPGSDDSVWRGVAPAQRMDALRGAASARNLQLRCNDVHAVLDRLTEWNAEKDHACRGRCDLAHVGMSGHSFGALTTQMVGGQNVPLMGQRQLEPRIAAALPMSPSRPSVGDVAMAFGKVKIPWLCMTGTLDVSSIGNQDAASRRTVFDNLPASIDRYELVLEGAEHSAFTERGLPGDGHARNPNHHRAILALSTAFWDSYLRNDAEARKWLQGDAAKAVLQKGDEWFAERGAPAHSPQK